MTTPRIVTVPGATPFVEIGIGDSRIPVSAGRWGIQRWNDPAAVWAGSEPYWLDVSCHVHAVDSYRGHERTTDRWNVGTCTITVNNADGWADPSTTPAAPAFDALRPGVPIRWGMTIDGVRRVMWRGVVDAQLATYDGRLAETDVVTFGAVDALGDAGAATVPQVAPVGAGETATARIHRILDAAGVAAAKRLVDVNPTPMVATDLGAQVVDLLAVTAESVGGAVYADTEARIVFRHRDWQTWVPGTPPDGTIGNVPGGVCPSSWEVSFDRADLVTRAIVGARDVVPVVVNDVAGQRRYGYQTGPERLDMVTTDTATLTEVANRLLRAAGTATMPRIRAATLDTATATAARDLAATVDPTGPTRYRAVLERAGRIVFDRTMFATSVAHTWDAAGWHVRIGLDDAAPWAAAGGRWSTGRWSTVTWATPVTGALSDLLETLEAAR